MLGAVAIAVFALGAGLALVGATQIGISNDQPVHLERTNMWFDTGWYVPEDFFDAHGQPAPEIGRGRWHSYGGSFSIVGHAVAVLAGAEQWGTVADTAGAYAARGVTLALLGIAAAAAVGFATAVTVGSRLAGWWAAAAMAAVPLWTGYGMFAIKDIPPAAGWTFVTTGLVVALHRSPGRRRQVMIALLCATGVWFTFGVRTALWVPLLVSVAVFGVLAVARRPVRGNLVAVAAGLVAGVVAVAALHYRNAATPVEWLVSSVRTSGNFFWTGTTLTAGHLVPEKPPWWYLPVWIGGSMPVLLGVLALGGAAAALVATLRQHDSGDSGGSRGVVGLARARLGSGDAVLALWGVQGLLLPLVATLAGATIYAGLRQHLYVLPALAALAGYGAARLLRSAVGRWAALAVPVVLAVALVAPVVEQLGLHPYQFVYKNALAGPVNDRWETDMHVVAGREALAWVPAGTEVLCFTRLNEPDTIGPCAEHKQFEPFTTEQGRLAEDDPEPDEVWTILRSFQANEPPTSCVDRGHVTRWLRGEEVVLIYVLEC